jgi:hypothetical protein
VTTKSVFDKDFHHEMNELFEDALPHLDQVAAKVVEGLRELKHAEDAHENIERVFGTSDAFSLIAISMFIGAIEGRIDIDVEKHFEGVIVYANMMRERARVAIQAKMKKQGASESGQSEKEGARGSGQGDRK